MFSKINLLAIVLCFLVAIDKATANNVYNYEFGNKHIGEEIDRQSGSIPLLSFDNDIYIHVPRNKEVSYVKVTVHALSAPKVDFDKEANKVSINYDFTQITYSSYSIFVKGIED